MAMLSPSEITARLFIGAYPGGIVYADRGRSEGGDYARAGFLPYASLVLDVKPGPLADAVRAHALTVIARMGELFALSATALRDASGKLVGCGQTVRLGGARDS
jgi:hypothetical protein